MSWKLITTVSYYKTDKSVSNKTKNLTDEINFLREKRNAIILAHYYQEPEIQDIADFIGDSLELSRKASETNADVIVFCGVHFMAETAKILCPNKTVLLPDFDAGCTLADDCQPDDFQKFLDKHPDHFAISYINCSAAVKAKSDLICTSSNAVDLVNKLPKDLPILFSPDRNLGRWVERQSGRKLTLWPGRCLVHETFNEESLIKLKIKNPNAEVLAHPECQESLLDLADFIGSTSKLLNYSQNSASNKFIVLTEPGIIHQMKLTAPLKTYIEVPGLDGCSCNECPYMRMNTLEKVYKCLKEMNPELKMDDKIREMAYKPMKKMLDMSN
ncbi:quinolinate synthase NadA [Prochlorococcus marinus]|uniref:quinolinate synthase NadA n=1 Tax=Prochlorococcus marinus TaxID=1219 RepID=UPI0022B4D056|nr:quinolinate synthase NadA [Prochlorococcus marinus]